MAKRSKRARSGLTTEFGLDDNALAAVVGGSGAQAAPQKQTEDAIAASVIAAATTQAEQHAAAAAPSPDSSHGALDTNHVALDAANLAHTAQPTAPDFAHVQPQNGAPLAGADHRAPAANLLSVQGIKMPDAAQTPIGNVAAAVLPSLPETGLMATNATQVAQQAIGSNHAAIDATTPLLAQEQHTVQVDRAALDTAQAHVGELNAALEQGHVGVAEAAKSLDNAHASLSEIQSHRAEDERALKGHEDSLASHRAELTSASKAAADAEASLNNANTKVACFEQRAAAAHQQEDRLAAEQAHLIAEKLHMKMSAWNKQAGEVARELTQQHKSVIVDDLQLRDARGTLGDAQQARDAAAAALSHAQASVDQDAKAIEDLKQRIAADVAAEGGAQATVSRADKLLTAERAAAEASQTALQSTQAEVATLTGRIAAPQFSEQFDALLAQRQAQQDATTRAVAQDMASFRPGAAQEILSQERRRLVLVSAPERAAQEAIVAEAKAKVNGLRAA
jgi:chromosome segregation ATPase